MNHKNYKITVVGLGYVGLPLVVAFGKHFKTKGFDINSDLVKRLSDSVDTTDQIATATLKESDVLFTSDLDQIKEDNVYILAIPTPVDTTNRPDLTLVREASKTVASILKKGDLIIYESTVYPGATEEVCLPILEEHSGLKAGVDFKIGYSPERLNPGDNEHDLAKIIKLVSAQDKDSLEKIAKIYETIIPAGVFKTKSIKVAEASKVVENTQRDLNIALMNELALIFDRMDIDTNDVIEAAGTKWNFTKYQPGLVGGHCIGVDPYYLTHKAAELDYHPEVILAGRRINDNMGKFIAEKTIKELIKNKHNLSGAVITIFGLAYKENCTDYRNSKTFDIIRELKDYNITLQIYDDFLNKDEITKYFDITLLDIDKLKPANALIFTVPHKTYSDDLNGKISDLALDNAIIIDVKGKMKKEVFTERGLNYWRL